MLNYASGDILDSTCDAIVIPVNCVGTPGKGLALQSAKRWPEWARQYKKYCVQGRLYPGKPLSSELQIDGRSLSIISFPTKDHWSNASRLEWVRDGLVGLRLLYQAEHCWNSIAIPPLGCGLGGLHWEAVLPFIETFSKQVDCRVDVYAPCE